ncbi:hypothetical protein SAMN05428949_0929 [Chitinophaga sp. YR627]|uniref:STM3941 family protein n=1 Tax=Chitinophaga sp. YR627 TaxID=1881041 RepID=UPI0008E82C75|nr:STM3941 family protein [Chitinophaga sp. YR627]SFM82522.1 hypothetical protein SAMN05428949_0929 [Chitinophaga sp. YR627]
MPNVNTIRIPLNRTRLLLALFPCGVSLLLIGFSLTQNDSTFLPPALIYVKNILGILGILLFGTCSVWVIMRLFRSSEGLFITAEGFTDRSSAAGGAPVKWEEIINVETREIWGQPILTIYLKDPAAYITRERNLLKRMVLLRNRKHYGSPLQIPISNVKSSPDELLQIILSRLDAHRTI